MDLIEVYKRAGRLLRDAREPETDRIVDARDQSRVIGVLGEAEVGKSTVVAATFGSDREGWALLHLDLAEAADESQVAHQLLRQIAEAYLGRDLFLRLSIAVLVPKEAANRRRELSRDIGIDAADEALRPWPSGNVSLTDALAATAVLAADRETFLWIDHVEAASLTPRHPLDVGKILWLVRGIQQRLDQFTLVISGREAFQTDLLGPEQAFHQQGRWLTIDNPPLDAWRRIGDELGVDAYVTDELENLTRGHPPSMLQALALATDRPAPTTGGAIILDLASASTSLAARANQHARSLHRLGGQVLVQVARGEPPYGQTQRGSEPQQAITRVLGRLRLAGLLRHDPEGWSVVDPRVRAVLRGEVRRTDR